MNACKHIVFDINNSAFYCTRFKGYVIKGCEKGHLLCYTPVLTEDIKKIVLPKRKRGLKYAKS